MIIGLITGTRTLTMIFGGSHTVHYTTTSHLDSSVGFEPTASALEAQPSSVDIQGEFCTVDGIRTHNPVKAMRFELMLYTSSMHDGISINILQNFRPLVHQNDTQTVLTNTTVDTPI